MTTLLPASRITLGASAEDWKDAISQSAALLERDGVIDRRYVEAIFESFEKNGDYMIVVPEVVLSHARPEHGALSTGLSLVTLAQPAIYSPSPERTITAVFTLAATDHEQHLKVMQALAELLIDDEALRTLLSARAKDEVLSLFLADL